MILFVISVENIDLKTIPHCIEFSNFLIVFFTNYIRLECFHYEMSFIKTFKHLFILLVKPFNNPFITKDFSDTSKKPFQYEMCLVKPFEKPLIIKWLQLNSLKNICLINVASETP